MKRTAFIGAVALATCVPAFGQAVVVPATEELADSATQNRFPWGPATGETISRYQQAHGAADLVDLAGTDISSVAFRHDFGGFPGDEPSFEYTNVTVTLSTGVGLVDALSTNLDDNVGADATLVYSGPYEMPALEGDLNPNPFDLLIEFTTNFPYAGGDLLVDIEISGPTPPEFYCDAVGRDTDTVSRAYIRNGSPSADSSGLVVMLRAEAECFLVIGAGPGDETFGDIGHVWTTQLEDIVGSHAVLLDDIPAFPVPQFMHVFGLLLGEPVGPAAPKQPVVLLELAAQVLMWNPTVFPGNPEQYTQGLTVRFWSDGRITSQSFGTSDGMHLELETFTATDGSPWFQFPFTIEGL